VLKTIAKTIRIFKIIFIRLLRQDNS
jgi:hypothetical protein